LKSSPVDLFSQIIFSPQDWIIKLIDQFCGYIIAAWGLLYWVTLLICFIACEEFILSKIVKNQINFVHFSPSRFATF
jgi:hypothetical protein